VGKDEASLMESFLLHRICSIPGHRLHCVNPTLALACSTCFSLRVNGELRVYKETVQPLHRQHSTVK
jgi:hypothetical protein